MGFFHDIETKARALSSGAGPGSEDIPSVKTIASLDTLQKEPIIHAQEARDLTIYSQNRLNDKHFGWFWRLSYSVDKLGETRGLERQPPDQRLRGTFWHFMRLMGIWFGAACTLPSMTGFFIGPLMFKLSFRASVSAGVLGVFTGSVAASLGAVMGPRSGLRSIIGTKYQFGWWCSKFIGLLNCCTLLGWLMVNANFAGQILSVISNQTTAMMQVGILIMALVSTIFAVTGIKILVIFETAFMIPIFVSFLLCYICAGHEFEVTQHSLVEGEDLRGAWLSFFQSCIGITSTWISIASDYYLDMPETSNTWVIYFFTLFSIFIPTAFVGILGVGLASAALYNPDKQQIYDTFGGGGLIWDAMKRWHGGGKFLVVLMYISLITNGAITNYSFGLSFQALGRPIARMPRYLLVILGAAIYWPLIAVGRAKWADIVGNFLPMIGYWSMIYAVILLIETFWFRRRKADDYQWDDYLNRKHFPFMYAAVGAFCCGVAGVVVGMNQYYYIGPLGKTIGTNGAELGTVLAVGFTAVSYVPLRYIEIKWRHQTPIRP